jgi:hypothetical protein
MMDALTKVLLTVSNALLVPDVLLLLVFMALTILYLGGMMAEAAERWRYGRPFWKYVADLKREPGRRVQLHDVPARHGFPAKVLSVFSPGAKEKWVDDTQLAMEASLARLNMGIRLGPLLGLAGTLIPLGPALEGLSTGNIAVLSQSLVVAFTTTVAGLFIGGLSYVMYSIRQRWYAQDLNDLEFILERMGNS